MEKYEEVRKRVIQCIEQLGFFIDRDSEDVDLSESIIDSLTFVQFLVELEEEFKVEIPDELLGMDMIKSLNGITNMVSDLLTD